MEIKKWDGVTDADELLKALLFFIDEEDEAKALTTSYGDFWKIPAEDVPRIRSR